MKEGKSHHDKHVQSNEQKFQYWGEYDRLTEVTVITHQSTVVRDPENVAWTPLPY